MLELEPYHSTWAAAIIVAAYVLKFVTCCTHNYATKVIAVRGLMVREAAEIVVITITLVYLLPLNLPGLAALTVHFTLVLWILTCLAILFVSPDTYAYRTFNSYTIKVCTTEHSLEVPDSSEFHDDKPVIVDLVEFQVGEGRRKTLIPLTYILNPVDKSVTLVVTCPDLDLLVREGMFSYYARSRQKFKLRPFRIPC